MDPQVSEWINLALRWIHVLAGVMWIGHLWFFNFVNSQLVKTYDADSKKKVLPELMPRALYFFRWGAAYTFVSGVLLAGIVYYMDRNSFKTGTGAGTGISLAILVVGWVVYDQLWKALEKKELVGVIVSYVLVVALLFGLNMVFEKRTVYIQLGMTFGTIMAANVWMRIWPAQRKIIAGVKGTAPAPDASVAARAGLRSKHNTYMSVPLIFTMVSNHYPLAYGHDYGWAILAGLVLVGWGMTKWLYAKSGQAAPASF